MLKVMSKNLFNSIKIDTPNRSTFDLTHDVKMSGQIGMLMPCLAMEVLPSDRITISPDIMLRFMPMLAPIMHRFDVYVHYFFSPNRIVWPNWEPFITGSWRGNVSDPAPPTAPFISTSGWTANEYRFADYLGVPPPDGVPTVNPNLNALPFAHVNKIVGEYYADQNYNPSLYQGDDYPGSVLVDGINTSIGVYVPRYRAWEHDRFTSLLPWAQKGEQVLIPIDLTDGRLRASTASGITTVTTNLGATGLPNKVPNPADGVSLGVWITDNSVVENTTSINLLRTAYATQRWLEKNARGGTRYTEHLLAHWGVRSSDARLQRPEFIVGLKAPVVVSEVLSTAIAADSSSGEDVPQGTMTGHGVSVSGGRVASYYCEEHGWIIGIVSVRPKPAYQQGIDKKFTRLDALDYYWPDFEHLGEEPVIMQELYAYSANATQTLGYTPRYSDYKYMYSRVAGQFRTTLDFWHAGRIFSSEPVIGEDFLWVKPADVNRIFAVQDDSDKILLHVLNKITANRPMGNYGIPI